MNATLEWMISVALCVVDEIMAADRNPHAAEIRAGVDARMRRMNMRDTIAWIEAEPEVGRAHWREGVRRHIVQHVADLRPS